MTLLVHEAKMDKSVTALTNLTNKKADYWKKSRFNLEAILPAYSVILAICLIGNTLVCVTVLRNKKMRSRWYSLLVNLSIADMGFALSTPCQLLQFADVDIGDAGCKSTIFVLDIFFGAALITLAVVSLDRYFGICKPSLRVGEKRLSAVVVIPLIWLAAAITYAPMLFVCKRSTKKGSLSCDCHSAWPREEHYTAYAFVIVTMTYLIPFATMAVCYFMIFRKLWSKNDENRMLPTDPTGSKKKSVKMLLVTTFLFFLCWTPYNYLYILKKLELVNPKIIGKLFLFSQVLGFANSAWNPFVYCIFSKNFREGFKMVCFWRKRNHANNQVKYTTKVVVSKKRSRTDTGYGTSITADAGIIHA